MSKSKEELNKLKEEVESVNEKLQELTPEELEQVNGGAKGTHISYLGKILVASDTRPSVVLVGSHSQCN